jgi:hypothetical protein
MLTFNPILKCGPDLTKKGIDVFLSGYHKKINYLGEQNTQVFIKKYKCSFISNENVYNTYFDKAK